MRYVNRLLLLTARLRQRGSALLVALMVMVGLSLLGLAFVAVSETESAISVTERNHAQVVATAEAGAKQVVQWFQDPSTAQSLQMMPDNSTGATWFKTQRVVGSYTGYYKPDTTSKICDTPYSPFEKDMFYGNEASADVIITRSTPAAISFLTNFNTKLLGTGLDPRETGEIDEIRIYAPPIQGGNLVADPGGSGNKFWVGGSRLGVATIAVRVDKYDKPASDPTRRSIATATCRAVVGKFPLPIPMGPLQSQTSLSTTGNFDVSWGLVSAQTSLAIKKDYSTLPWVNAYERLHYDRGYDSSQVFQPNHTYYRYDIARPLDATITANPLLKAHEYWVKTAPTGPSAATEPAWPTNSGGTVVSGGVTFTERYPSAYPITTAASDKDNNQPWLWWLATGTNPIADPWFQARSAGPITSPVPPNAQPQPYTFPYSIPNSFKSVQQFPPIPTHWFQYQSFDQYNMYRRIVFPNIDYDYWKATAIAGNGQNQVHYLYPSNPPPLCSPTSGTSMYTDGVSTLSFNTWTSKGSGYYFFDTCNQLNPQNSGPGTLNGTQNPGSSASISGFAYVNAAFSTTGVKSPSGWFSQPGEPYEDIGYRQVAISTTPTTTAGNFVTDASGQPVIAGAYNGGWDYEDLPWSNNLSGCCTGSQNHKFDVCVAPHTVTPPGGGAAYTGWFVLPYYPGCKPGNNIQMPNCECSEPHEPYLNVIYDGSSLATCTAPNTCAPLNVGWEDPSSEHHIAKTTADGSPYTSPVDCSSYTVALADNCTSNGYEKRGGLVQLSPAVNGVLYAEGQLGSTGNAVYYGAVLVGPAGIDTAGTPKVWYDERLQDGTWLPPGLPRVIITSLQTDQN